MTRWLFARVVLLVGVLLVAACSYATGGDTEAGIASQTEGSAAESTTTLAETTIADDALEVFKGALQPTIQPEYLGNDDALFNPAQFEVVNGCPMAEFGGDMAVLFFPFGTTIDVSLPGWVLPDGTTVRATAEPVSAKIGGGVRSADRPHPVAAVEECLNATGATQVLSVGLTFTVE